MRIHNCIKMLLISDFLTAKHAINRFSHTPSRLYNTWIVKFGLFQCVCFVSLDIRILSTTCIQSRHYAIRKLIFAVTIHLTPKVWMWNRLRNVSHATKFVYTIYAIHNKTVNIGCTHTQRERETKMAWKMKLTIGKQRSPFFWNHYLKSNWKGKSFLSFSFGICSYFRRKNGAIYPCNGVEES